MRQRWPHRWQSPTATRLPSWYLNEAPAVAELLELPDHVTQICLFPVAHTIGTDFTPTSRRYPATDIAYFDRYGRTKT